MKPLHISMNEYRKQLERGHIQVAYRALMDFFSDLRLHFKHEYPDFATSSSIYYGYMDMTFFAVFPGSLRRRKLKIVIVFIHERFTFEVWLSGANRAVQRKYWDLLHEAAWDKYQLALDPGAVDYAVSHVLVNDPDFGDLEALTGRIERGVVKFIRRDVEEFFST